MCCCCPPTALARLAPPSFWPHHLPVRRRRAWTKALKAQLTLAGYQHVSQVVSPGEYAVRGGLIDLFPMGSPVPTAWTCSATRSTRSAPSTPTASAACTRCPRCACCRAASSRWTTRAHRLPARWREASKATRRARASTRTSRNGIATGGIEYYLPLFFEQTATVFDYLGRRPRWCCTATWTMGARALLDRHARAPPLPCSTTQERPLLPPGGALPAPEEFFAATQPLAAGLRGGNEPVPWRAAARHWRRPRRHRAAARAGTAPRQTRTAC